jgi:Spy/CpxP family protein refolding chaperone
MRAKILMLVMLMSFSAVLMAQTTEVVPKKEGKTQRGAGMNEMRGPRANEMRAAHMNKMKGAANGLNLTKEQKEAFKKSMMATHKQLQPLRNELGEAEAHQRTLTMAEKPEIGAINKNIEKIGAIKIEMAKIQAKSRLEMRAQLTDEQRLKAELFRAKMKPGQGEMGRDKMHKKMMKGKGPRGERPGMR